MAKYQAYAEYKDSGVEWLGDLPSHWHTVSLKMLIDVRDGTHDTPSYVESNSNTYPLVTSKDVTGGRVDLVDCKHISEADYLNIIKRSEVAKGDILMPMIGTVGSPVLVEDNFEIAIKNLALFKTSISNEKLDSKFLLYFLNSSECEMQFSLEGKGGVQNFVSLGTLRNLILPLTKIYEQSQIANFLDHETAKIDTLIAKQEKLIELLKEKRQAVISHAVTKGLNPNVPMKDSGVAWLGEVPEHWEVTRFAYQIFYQEGPGILAVDFHETGIPLLRIQNVKSDFVSNDYKTYLLPSKVLSKWDHYRVEKGDLIISCSASTGLVSEVDESTVGAIPYTGLIRLKPRTRKIISQYIKLLVQSDLFFEQIEVLQTGSTIQHFGPFHLQQMYISLPPNEEQEVICLEVKNRVRDIENLILKAESAIQLMQERRTALISAAVTGKIDVRNWQAPMLAEADTELSA
ncbi:restriction endonuclease subunit S [Acinetobacter indicus]|uniref:restriction endonuclease subunit S n=1 Tax=Acinetobacter indicus TaxID=756892 RepID=UPI0009491F58|nr:restriction endonuclease subunit S [Acinetobacter indicus]